MTILLGPTPCHGCGAPVTVDRLPMLYREPVASRKASRRLTDDQVREARAMRAAGEFLHVIGERFGVYGQSIAAILDGRTYRDVETSIPGQFSVLVIDAEGIHNCPVSRQVAA